MNRIVLALLLAVFAGATASPAAAGDGPLGLGLLKRKPKDPAARAKQLVGTLQSDPDERKRKAAAEELREFDPRNNPDVIPALIGSLQKDPSALVRIEAAESIGKMKPVSQPAGIAMESAFQADPEPKVREAVQAALWQYHLNGYRTPPTGSPLASQTPEPPIAGNKPVTAAVRPGPKPTTPSESAFRPIANTVGKGVVYQPTVEPPLAKPKPAPKPELPSELPAPKRETTIPVPTTPLPTPAVPPVPAIPVAPTVVPTTPLPPITVPSAPTVPVPPPVK